MRDDVPRKQKKQRKIKVKSNHTPNRKISVSWVITTILLTFILSITISVCTQSFLDDAAVFSALLILSAIILLGILFDILGIAVTTASETPFHAMASNRIRVAEYAIRLIRNAEKVSNFCNDVVGDICGIISGATGTFIVTKIVSNYSFDLLLTTLVASGLISALTVGGKALGKTFAINQCNQIVYKICQILFFFNFTKAKKKKEHKRKNSHG